MLRCLHLIATKRDMTGFEDSICKRQRSYYTRNALKALVFWVSRNDLLGTSGKAADFDSAIRMPDPS